VRPPQEHHDWSSRGDADLEPIGRGLTSAADAPIDEGAPFVQLSTSAPRPVPKTLASSIAAALWKTTDPVGVPDADPAAGDRYPVSPGALRRSARRGTLVPAAVALYGLLSDGGPTRPTMLLLSLALLVTTGAVWLGASALARSEHRQAISVALLLFHLGAYGVLAHLDGGVTSPLGLLLLFAVCYLAVSVALRAFLVLAGWAALGYGAVLVLGDSALAPAVVQAWILLGAGLLCARHSTALSTLRSRLAEISRIDPATGYLNRRGFDERLDQELSRAARAGQPLTLVVVNPDLGPAPDGDDDTAANETLARTSRALGETARAHDAIGRLRHDDFALILTDTGPDAAAIVVDRLRNALAGASPARVGHASFPREAAHPQALFRLATQRSNAYRFVRRRHARPGPPARPPAHSEPTETMVERVRRPLAIADLAAVAGVVFAAGAVHGGLLAERAPSLAVLLLSLVGLVGAVAAGVAAPVLSRSGAARLALAAVVGPLAYVLLVVAVAVDGGLTSPLAVGLLAPLPLVALHVQRDIVTATLVGVGVLFFFLGVSFGSPGLWHVLYHLGGVAAVVVACLRRQETSARHRAAFTDLSLVDGMTDTLNRRGLQERFETDVARTYRQGGRITLIAIDLDAFDETREVGGRDAARQLLRWTATVLGEVVRGHDVVGRLDDDEFVVLVSDCDGAQAAAMAARLRGRLAERTGIGFGTATLGRHGNDFETLHRYAVTARGTAKAAASDALGT
jgi:diguanylate cyclase (GGDEF)-like protein